MSEDNEDLQLDQQIETPEIKPPETPAPEPKVEEPAKPLSLREQLTESVKKLRERDETGKFVKEAKVEKPAPEKKVEQPKVDVKPSEGAKPGAVQSPQTGAAPGTWRASAKAKWEAIDPEVRAEVLKRESESTREIAKFQQQIQQINQAYTPIEQLIGPRRALWRAQYGSEDAALKQLLNLSDLASSNPTEFLQLCLNDPNFASRIDMQKVFGQGQPGQPEANPQVNALQQKIAGLEQQLNGFVSQNQTQQQASISQQISEFASAKDQAGNLLRPHFESVREDVFNLIPTLKAQFPGFTVPQIMEKAYAIAVNTNDTVSQEISRLNEQRIREDIEKAERVKKAQLANKSLPTGGAPVNGRAVEGNPSDLRATLLKNMRAYNQGNEPRI